MVNPTHFREEHEGFYATIALLSVFIMSIYFILEVVKDIIKSQEVSLSTVRRVIWKKIWELPECAAVWLSVVILFIIKDFSEKCREYLWVIALGMIITWYYLLTLCKDFCLKAQKNSNKKGLE